MAIVFTAHESGSTGTLYAGDGSSATDWIGYYLPTAAAQKPVPQSLTFAESWDYWGTPKESVNGGCYVIIAQQPPPGAADEIATLLTGLTGQYAYRYVLWLEGTPLAATGTVPFAQAGAGADLIQDATVALGTLELVAQAGITLTPGGDGASLVLGRAGKSRLYLQQTVGTPTPVGTVTSDGTIALAGPGAGSIGLNMELSGVSQRSNDFDTLGVGIKYFYETKGICKSQLFPLLNWTTAQDPVQVSVKLDPVNPMNESLTRLTFESANTFSTTLRTTTGIALTLTPVAADAGLALAPDRVTEVGSQAQIDSYYPTLSGAFSIGPVGAVPSGPLPLLCGMSGLEAMSVTPAEKQADADVLRFHPANPAFAPNFPPAPVSLDKPAEAGIGTPPLLPRMTTAWVTVEPRSAQSSYYAQPHGAPLFGAAAPSLGFLPFAERPAGVAAKPFPFASYSGLTSGIGQDAFDWNQLLAFEQSVLSPTRRANMGANPLGAHANFARAVDDGSNQATTPQGFLVTLGAGDSWASLLLAQTTGDQTKTLEFEPVDDKVKAAFSANQLFLVATCAPWTAGTFKNSIDIEDWPFEVDVGTDQSFGSYSNVLIGKFCHGKLEDLIKDPRRWTDAGDFNKKDNNELLAVSEWLQSYFADAEAKAKLPSSQGLFDHFVTIAKDEQWQGVLVLRVTVPLEDLPAQVRALEAGLSQSKFYAHHLGIEVTKVNADAGLSVDGTSSLFGLIDYVDPLYAQMLASGGGQNTPIPPTPGLTYDFKVLSLLVQFENSEVKSFQSKSQVTLNEWFGDPVLRTRLAETGGSVTNSIVIDGVLQRHDGQPVYLFNSAVDTVFDLDSNVLPSVEVTATTLTTVKDVLGGAASFRFAFSGDLVFASLPGLDAFSFRPPGHATSGGGLAFSDLYLDLDYDPSQASPRTFTFTPDRIAFDLASSTPDGASLYSSLPLTLQRLVIGSQGSPSDQGFLPVSVPDVQLSSLPAKWYGLMFDFDLGSPGALASEAGWTAGLLVAWGPGSTASSTTARAFVGMQLPGAGGHAKLLSLQGVLKLTIDQLELTYTQGAYLLKLTEIALHFLSLQFPPGGSTAFYLFGQPGAPGQRSHTAWYAAYAKTPPKKALGSAAA